MPMVFRQLISKSEFPEIYRRRVSPVLPPHRDACQIWLPCLPFAVSAVTSASNFPTLRPPARSRARVDSGRISRGFGPMNGRQFIYHMQGLTKTYPPAKKVLDNIHLSFYPDAKIGVLGVNGSGKSTLLRIMAGIDTEIGRAHV